MSKCIGGSWDGHYLSGPHSDRTSMSKYRYIQPRNGRKTPDLAGQRFHRLTVISLVLEPGKQLRWLCSCECGATKVARPDHLINGRVKSCGCWRQDFIRGNETHGEANTDEYSIWVGMIYRCQHVQFAGYHNYGGRGIRVCDRWRRYEDFLEDMGRRPTKRHSLDRIDNNGNYEPGNVRWATRSQQMRNTRRSRNLTYNGKTMTVVEWAELLGWSDKLLEGRLRLGWAVDRILTEPPTRHGPKNPRQELVRYDGRAMTVAAWAKEIGVNPITLGRRLLNGWTVERALTEPTGYSQGIKKSNANHPTHQAM